MRTESDDKPKRSAIESAFGRHVRRLREQIGWTQAQLSDALRAEGVSMTSGQVAKFERGERPINFAELDALAGALQVALPRLVNVEEWSQDEVHLLINRMQLTRLLALLERNEEEHRALVAKIDDVKAVYGRMVELQKSRRGDQDG